MNRRWPPMGGSSAAARRSWAVVVGMTLAAAVLVGCAPSAPSSAGTTAPTSVANLGKVTTGPDGVQEVTLQTQDDYRFTPDHFTVHPGKVRLTVTNVGHDFSHNFLFTPGKGPAVISAQIPLLASGQEKTIDFTVTTPGDYPFECSFHIEQGMVGTMTVTGG